MEKKNWLSIVMAAMSLLPLTAHAEELEAGARAVAPEPVFLSHSEVTSEKDGLIRRFRASLKGNQVVLNGRIPNECAGKVHSQFETRTDEKKFVVSISVEEGGRACLKAAKAKGGCAVLPCTDLKDQGFVLTLPEKDWTVAYGEVDPEDMGLTKITDLTDVNGEVLKYTSLSTRKRLEQEKEEARQAAQNELWREQLVNCRKDEEELAIARSALENLCSKDEEYDEEKCLKFTRSIDKALLDQLIKRSDKIGSEERDDYMDELLAHAEANPEHADRLAGAFYKLAIKHAGPGKTSADYDEASRIIGKAQELEGLSEVAQARLEGYLTDIQVARTEALFQNGLQGNYLAQPAFYSLMNRLQANVMKSCRAGMNEACANAMSSFKSASRLPEIGRQVDQSKAALQQQMMQALYGSNQGAPTQGGNQMGLNYGMPNQYSAPFSSGFPPNGML